MYQPYDPYVQYQPYNDPHPEHYTSGLQPGMPQPTRPTGFGSTDPAYPSYQDQYYGANNSYDAQYGSQPYGAQAHAQPSYYPANPTSTAPDYSHSGSHYPPLGQSGPAFSHSPSHHYPPASSESSFYPSVSSAPYSSHTESHAPYSSHAESHAAYSSHTEPHAENSWAPSYPPRKEKPKDERPVLSTHSVPKRDDKKENIRYRFLFLFLFFLVFFQVSFMVKGLGCIFED